MSYTISDEQLQHAIDISAEYGREEAAKKLGVQVDTIRRYEAEAKERGLAVSGGAKFAKILVLDIETSLMTFFGWSPGKQYVGPDQIIDDWHVLSWACRWLFEPDTYSDVLTPEEAKAHDDRRIVESIWQFLDEADLIIAHNGKRFDMRKLNARFIQHEIKPYSPLKVIDTLHIMRSIALFSSNKQDELCKRFGLQQKMEHEGYSLWQKCYRGDPKALLTMEAYNKVDIMGLEELYVYIRPWIKGHPNMNLYVEGDGNSCPTCGGGNMKWMNKFYVTAVNKYSSFRCLDCGAIGRSRETAISPEKRIKISSIAQ